jgi:glucarate dehydratase
MLIRDIIITPLAFRDPPLLNAAGLHEPLALRTVVQLVLDDGVVGLGEGRGGLQVLERLRAVAPSVIGLSVLDLQGIERAVDTTLGGDGGGVSRQDRRVIFAPLEVAALDAQGKLFGVPVCDLLGGAVRDEVPFAGYLFYKWAGHPNPSSGRSGSTDAWGEALDPEGIVEQARQLVAADGYRSLKLKAGVFPPEQEIAAIRALRDAFPDHPLRIDPNGAWTHETSLHVAEEIGDLLEYLEDPVLGIDGMSAVHAATGLPLATNMCVVAFEHLAESVAKDAVQIILGDHHYWGGLRHTQELGAICRSFAIPRAAAATPAIEHACDTHYPWNRADDVVRPGVLEFREGSLRVPRAPGLGVELDPDALARQHEVFLASGRTERDDATYIRRFDPTFDPALPRF